MIKDPEINSQSSEEKKENMILIEMVNIELLQDVLDKGIESGSPLIFPDKKGNIWQINLHNELQQEISNSVANENPKAMENEQVSNTPIDEPTKEEKLSNEVID